MRGAKWLAREAQSLDAETPQSFEPEPLAKAATAPLAEVAAAHDGQPVDPWVRMFRRKFGAE